MTARSSGRSFRGIVDRHLTPRGQDRRRQLLDFAARRFAEGGYHPTSVAEIVDGLGVGKGVFYWYFSSKEELLLEILRDAQTDLRRAQQAAIGDEADPVRRIELGIRSSMRWLAANRHLVTLIQFASTEERFAPTLRRGREVTVSDVVPHVREALDRHAIPDADPLVVTHAILGVIDSLAGVYLMGVGDDPDKVAEAAIAFCLEGMLGPARVRL